jgi:hypothetical protein
MRGFTRIDGPVQIVAVRVRDPSPSSSGSMWFLRFFGRQPPDRLMPSSRSSSRVANQLPVVVSFVLALCFACWFTATGRKPNLNTNSTFCLLVPQVRQGSLWKPATHMHSTGDEGGGVIIVQFSSHTSIHPWPTRQRDGKGEMCIGDAEPPASQGKHGAGKYVMVNSGQML